MKKKRKKQMIILGMIFLLILLGAINFFSVRRDALTRFSAYEDKAKTIKTTYGKLSYIDEGQGEVILSCHGICGAR